ncbi:hypothetical protein [Lutibacter maritimus]|uniref:Uncharacterized protein n=1 Tax=Lutibacter maritimus TaxID=593133 RepID=A0A1I6NSI4_9FLAO|nr:hypothetical protein [Lutibacter maritimus]SFS30809.1 hypothetical protein SAMN04488006_0489 [Lutibacter maritimus]
MKKAFNTIYKRLLKLKLDENILCSTFWRKIIDLHNNYDENACWKLLTNNFEWLINSGVASTSDIKKWFNETELNSHNIYITGTIHITDKKAIGLGDAKITADGHSKVILFDYAHCEAFDSSFVKGFQNSTFRVKECIGEAFDKCKCIADYQSKVEAWGNATVEAKDYAFVIKHENATGLVSSRAFSIIQ